MAEVLLELQHAYYSYPQTDVQALNDVTLSVRQGEYIALLGANGSGKSTLARLFAGFFEPDSGTRTVAGGVIPGIVFQQPKDQIVAAVVERDTSFGPQNLDMDDGEIELRTMECLSLVGLGDRALSRSYELSLGQTQRLAFAGILALFPDLLILDEVTAMLDPAARHEILQLIDGWQKKGHAVIHVTHDLDETLHADRVIVLDHGRVVFDGDRQSFMADGSLLNSLFGAGSLSESRSVPENAETTLRVRNLSFSYPSRKVFSNLSFELKKGTVTALTGPSGCGKSTLFECLAGLRAAGGGTIEASGRPVLALQESEASLFETYAADDVAFGPGKKGLEGEALVESVKKSMDMVGLPYDEFADRGTFKLSGGEKRKLSLAGIIALDADVMIFDEPTSALDPLSRKKVLESLRNLADNGKTVLFSTHRMEEADIADNRLVWENLTAEQNSDSGPEKKTSAENENLNEYKLMPNASLLSSLQKTASALTAPPEIPDSVIGKLGAGGKFALFLALFVGILASGSLWFSLAMLFLTVCYALLAKYPLKKPLYALWKLLPLLILFSAFQFVFYSTSADTTPVLFKWKWLVITQAKVGTVLKSFVRAPAVIIALGTFIFSTDERQIMDGMAVLLKPLSMIGVPVRYFVLTVGIMFRFVPLLLEELSDIIKTQLVRGVFSDAKGLKKILMLVPLFVPLILQTFRKSQAVADALTARYFS
jgi:energy-coupling factor transport system ATP-binding protein